MSYVVGCTATICYEDTESVLPRMVNVRAAPLACDGDLNEGKC